jgi:hypothetical protein
MAKKIICTFPLDNHTDPVAVEADGFRGVGCKAVTQAFAAALGTTVGTKDKRELFQNGSKTCLSNG